jgi:hypothetical protein
MEGMAMRTIAIGAVALGLLFSISAKAGTTDGSNLLSQVTAGNASTVEPLTVAQLDDVRGAGTIEKFIALPRFHRDFTKTVSLDNGLSVSIVGVAGEGLHITITNPNIP